MMRFSPLLFSAAALAQQITHGPMAGDVTGTSAVLWARADRACELRAVVGSRRMQTVKVTPDTDFAGKIRVTGLRPSTEYRYSISASDSSPVTGVFRTAPSRGQAAAVTFAWGGDVAGQNVCRDAVSGFPIFSAIARTPLDFFLGLGDMIYADNTCEKTGRYGNAQVPGGFGPATDSAGYWNHWKYTFGDAGLRSLLARIPYLAIWDDHEVVNDFGPSHDTRDQPPYTPGKPMLPVGLSAFLDYNPVLIPGAPKRLYRNFRWGRHLEIILLDTRQYRDSNSKPDGPAKSLLGAAQMAWLKRIMSASDATWKVIVSSVPISIPTGSQAGLGRDGWANGDATTGAETELRQIFEHLERSGSYGNIWITTDVHFASAFEYTPFPDRPKFKVHEVITGPLNAGLFPSDRYDRTFAPRRLFWYGPPKNEGIDWQEARRWMNYGVLQISAGGDLVVAIHDVEGARLWELGLAPPAPGGKR